jgi:hypothetical protein
VCFPISLPNTLQEQRLLFLKESRSPSPIARSHPTILMSWSEAHLKKEEHDLREYSSSFVGETAHPESIFNFFKRSRRCGSLTPDRDEEHFPKDQRKEERGRRTEATREPQRISPVRRCSSHSSACFPIRSPEPKIRVLGSSAFQPI